MIKSINVNAFFALLLFLLLTASEFSSGAVIDVEIADRRSFAGGRVFEGIGAYRRISGRVKFEVDPKHPVNQQIIDLELAQTNTQGKVEFSADFEIIAPVDLSKANGTLFYDVNNRGRRMCLKMFNEGADDFLMRQGYVVVWCGWIAEVLPVADESAPEQRLLRLDAPIAKDGGKPIAATCRAEIMINEPATRHSISNRPHVGAYRPTERGLSAATLTWRLRKQDRRVPIPRDQWRLEIKEVTAPGHKHCLPKIELVMPAGLRPGYIYELLYEAQDPVVQGLGFAAIRDLVSFLKNSTSDSNPLRLKSSKSSVSRAVGFGISQSGRCLRMFLYQGFNADENGHRVFDGMIPHVSGGGLGFFNHRFAAPTRYATQHANHLFPCDMFPFTYETQSDSLSGREDGILARAREANVVPKVMHIQNSAEYWNRSGSLVHTDTLGRHDAEIPPEVRIYAVGGAQHGWGDDEKPASPQVGQLQNNPTDYRPHLRAMLTALDQWIRDGTEPPPSVYPRIADGTLVDWRQLNSGWSALPGVRYPDVIQQAELLDYGPEFWDKGRITIHPPRRLAKYPVLVPAHDEDNNERGMLKLPAIAVPVGTYTGWNLRERAIGAENEMTRLRGAFIPFARTKTERTSVGDPRLSLSERYGNFDNYLQKFRSAADRLVEQRYLLREDANRLIRRAERNRKPFQPN